MVKRNPPIINRNIELWKSIPDFPGYFVSSFGKVLTFKRYLHGRIRKQTFDNGGYLGITLHKNGKRTRFSSHVLVMSIFGPKKPTTEYQINHKDGDKTFNWIVNLEWVTAKENIEHAFELGLRKIGETNPLTKLNKKDRIKIRNMYSTGKFTQKELAFEFNVKQPLISSIVLYKKEWEGSDEAKGKDLIQLSTKTASILRKKQWQEQSHCCSVLNKEIFFEDSVLDHLHKLKKEIPGPGGKGLVRGVLDYRVNGFEGYITKKYKRQGLTKLIPLPELLRNLADYLEQPTCQQIFIYPSEKVMAPFLKISEYKRIVKYYNVMFPRRKKIPPYPPSKIKKVGKKKKGQKQKYKYVARMSKKWQKLLDDANTIHANKGKP